MKRWEDYLNSRLEDLALNKERELWDGEWPTLVTISQAGEWAVQLFPDEAPSPSVVPTSEGNIQFIWLKGGRDIELEVDGEGGAYVIFSQNGTYLTLDMDEDQDRERFRELLSEIAK